MSAETNPISGDPDSTFLTAFDIFESIRQDEQPPHPQTPSLSEINAWLCPRCVADQQLERGNVPDIYKLNFNSAQMFTRAPSERIDSCSLNTLSNSLESSDNEVAKQDSHEISESPGGSLPDLWKKRQVSPTVHAKRKFVCPLEGCVDQQERPRRFERKEHLKRHWKTVHEKKEKFVCHVQTNGQPCGKTFSREDNLKSHQKTHISSPLQDEQRCRKLSLEDILN